MATEIKVWQIIDGKLQPIEIDNMVDAKKKEVQDLEQWIKTDPSVLGQDILIIGKQVPTKGGTLDFLAIDKSGDLVVVELKRDNLAREALAQAIDYSSDIASWDVDRISDECFKYTGQTLEDYLINQSFVVNLDELTINKAQRILLVGFSIEESLQRMIEWLSGNFGVAINFMIFKYIQTQSGDELLARTMIIPEEVEKEKAGKQKKQIQTSEKVGEYPDDELRTLLKNFLSQSEVSPRRIRKVLLPLCLQHGVVTREMIINRLMEEEGISSGGKAGSSVSGISNLMSSPQRLYLRQIILYNKPNEWEKDNYQLVQKYKEMIQELLTELDAADAQQVKACVRSPEKQVTRT